MVDLTYIKKTTGRTVVRDVGAMSQRDGFLYAQHKGQIKRFIPSRIIEAAPNDSKFKPTGGYKSEI